MLLKQEGFTHTPSLKVNWGYHHIYLYPGQKQIVTSVLKFEYQELPMGVCNIPDIINKEIRTLLGV